MQKIRWEQHGGIAIVIAIVSFLAIGCSGVKTWAPELNPPPRPQLTTIPAAGWRSIDGDTRRILTDNQEKIFQYTEQLEWILNHYNVWRTGKSK